MNIPAHWLLIPLLTLSAQAGAEVYKCRLPSGQVEITNAPCPKGSGTLTVRPDEKVSEAERQQAEREVERIRLYVDKREAALRAEQQAEAERSAAQQRSAASNVPSPTTTGSVEECLRELDRRPLESGQRAEMEANCRNQARSSQPVYVPVPVPAANPAGICIENVLRLKLAPAEQGRRLALCQGQFAPAQPAMAPPVQQMPSRPAMPTPVETPHVVCPPNNKNCGR